MSAIPLNPFNFFTDLNGKALDQGYIYIGLPNLDPRTNQIQAYYDKDLTIPVVQPLRTHHGLLISGCGPTTIYANITDFSVLVLDKKEKQVMSIPSMLTAMHGSWGWKNDRYYLTRAAFVADAAIGNLNSLSDGTIVFADGLLYLRKIASTMIADLTGWVPAGVTELRHFGAVINADSTAAIQNAVDSKLSVLVKGKYLATAQIITTGSLLLYGEAKHTSQIIWTLAATSLGIKTTLNNWNFDIDVSKLALLTQKAGTGTALHLDYTPAVQAYMAGTGTIDFFKIYTNIKGCQISGETSTTTQGWQKGIHLDCPFAFNIEDNDIFGMSATSAKITTDFVADSVGIHVPDQTIRTLANAIIHSNRICNFLDAAIIYNVEGVTFTRNDLQVNYNGLTTKNVISKLNQYRIFSNHIGVSNTQIKISNARQVLIEHNEISYRYGRTDGGSVPLIVIDGVQSFNIIGNSIRGNIANDTDVVIDGIEFRWDSNTGASDFTRYGVVVGNSFQNIRHCMNNSAADNLRYLSHANNAREGIRGKYLNSSTQSANMTQPILIGNGAFDQIDVATSNIAQYIEQFNSAPQGLNRVGGGTVTAFYNGPTLVGSIVTAASSTAYNTTSDQILKNDNGLLDPVKAKEVIRLIQIHNYDWKVDGSSDIGVFAQELYEVYPQAVTKGGWFKDGETACDEQDEEAYYRPWSVDYSKLVPVIICALASVLP